MTEETGKAGIRASEKKRHFRYALSYLILAAFVVILIIVEINAGSVHIPGSEILKIIFSGAGSELESGIVLQIRVPRAIAAALLGGALALSGFLLQTFFRNPIAGPFVLGISSGAKMAVALTMIFLLQYGMVASSWTLIAAAFAGSLVTMLFVLAISGKIGRSSMLIVCGVMVGYICSAVTDFAVTFADDSDIVNLHNWSLGSFSGIDAENIAAAAIIIAFSSAAAFLCAKPIGAYQLGEEYAKNMGVNLCVFRVILILISSLLSACVAAFAGPVSFVGVAVPHIVRRCMKTSKPLVVMPACFLGGSAFCLLCDLIARTAFAPSELSINAVTAVFGAPVVILVMIRKRKDPSL